MASLIAITDTVVAVVGVAKNCGKTTTLNRLVDEAYRAGRRVGLVSVGIDGESKDALVGTPKPPIVVHPGQLVATTRQMLHASSADVEFLDVLGFTTPLGEAVLARVASEGEVVLGGMRHRADVALAVQAMKDAGADQIWIDGAYGRIGAAHPSLSDGVVVATGAVVGQRISVIVEKTADLVERLTLPRADVAWHRDLIEQAVREDQTLLGRQGSPPITLPARSALLGLSRGRDLWEADVSAIAIPGLVSDRVAQELLRRPRGGTLLVPDGTNFQVDAKIARRLRKLWDVRTLESCRLLAISFNPTSLRGHVVPGDHLAQALRTEFPNITVFDPIVGLQ